MATFPTTINDYLDLAKAHAQLKTDSRLAAELGINRVSVLHMREGMMLPSENTLLRIVELANPKAGDVQTEQKKQALLQLAAWRLERAMKSPEAQKLFAEIIAEWTAKAKHAAATIIFALFLAGHAYPPQAQARTAPAQAAIGSHPMYIMENGADGLEAAGAAENAAFSADLRRPGRLPAAALGRR